MIIFNSYYQVYLPAYIMGIDGLLRLLKPITQKQHISSFKNQRVGVDIMPWIYHGCYSCSYELNRNIQSIKFLYYLLQMIEMLSYYNIKPIFVFDGRTVQLKSLTNEKRKKSKEQNKAKALQFMKEGKIDEARKYFSRSIFLDERIINLTINVLFTKNLQFIIAPYQADCQLAKLKKLGLIDVVISQDSDLLAYGVNTILKLNQNGDCDYVDLQKWRPRDVDTQFLKQYLSMNKVNRVQAAVLAGTDYNPSIKGIGIKRGVRNLYRQRTMKNVISKLKSEKVYMDKIPEEYVSLIQNVKLVFFFATVYNPITKEVQPLNPQLLEECKPDNMSVQELQKIIGVNYPQYIEKQVYCGKAVPKTLKQRNITAVNIKQIFTVNKDNLLLHETINNQRKEEVDQVRVERQQKITNGQIQIVELKPREHRKYIKPKKELDEKQKQERKNERKNRINRLQNMMNSVVDIFSDEEKNSGIAQKIKESNKEEQRQKYQQIQESSQSSQSSSEEKSEEVQEESVNLGFLNPFLKVEYQNTSEKKKEQC